MFNILKFIFKGETILYLIAVFLVFSLLFYYDKSVRLEALSNINESNYIQQRDKDSLKVVRLQFATKNAMEDYVSTNNNLRRLLTQSKIKAKNIKQVITQQNKYIDSLQRSTNVSPIIESIRANVPSKQTWVDVSKCLIISGDVNYINDSLFVNVNKREFNDTTTVVAHTIRRQWSVFGLFKTRVFGKKIIKVTTNNN